MVCSNEALCCFENSINMTFYFYFPPLSLQHTSRINQECTPFNSHVFPPVKIFLFYDIKLPAQLFVCVRKQIEWERLLGAEVFVSTYAIPGDPKNIRTGFCKLLICITEILAFECAARSVIFWVKIQDDVRTFKIVQRKHFVASGGKGEICNALANVDHEHFLSVLLNR